MLFEDISILDENLDYQPHQWVGVREGRIDYIGGEAPANAADYGEVYKGEGRLLMPTLYNLHTHAPMTLLRGYAENLPLQAWLNDMVWPFEAKMTPEDNYWGTLLACAEMARYGTVSFSDMYYSADERIRAAVEAGMKINVCESELFFEEKHYAEYPNKEDNERFIKQYHEAYNGRVRIDYNIHAEYTSNPLTCTELAQEAKKAGLPICLHLSETKSEHEECKQRHGGLTPLRYFESIGVLDVPVVAAHCVWVEDDDIACMKEHGVSPVLNPASNMKLGSGFAPADRMLNAGLNVCLGTDGMASNNNHDMFQDMYLMALIYKGASFDPAIVSPKQVLHAATRAGALAQGRTDCGSIAVGMKADICVLDITGPAWSPLTNPLVNLIYSAHGSDVVLTMCDGEVIYKDGMFLTLDIEEIKHEVEARTKRIIASV